MALFLALLYTEVWLTSTNTSDSPKNDLKLLKKLSKTEENVKKRPAIWPTNFLSFVVGAREKFESLLWYLSERLVPLSLFSNNLGVSVKQLRKSMIKFESTTSSVKQKVPQYSSFGKKNLKVLLNQKASHCFGF